MTQSTVKTSDFRAASHAGEWIWGGIGIGAASLSACFAAYMMAFGPAETTGRNLGDFGLFARMQPIRRGQDGHLIQVLPGAVRTVRTADSRDGPATASGAVDFDPTGSLKDSPGNATRLASTLDPGFAGPEKMLTSFVLRDVFDGQALVQTPSNITLVSKGSVIAGAGEVLSIERRGRQWAVVTKGGIIGGQR